MAEEELPRTQAGTTGSACATRAATVWDSLNG